MTRKTNQINIKIAIKIRLERTKRGISQEKLAELAGMNKNSIGAIERGYSSPTIDTLEKIAKALDIAFLDLVDVSKVDL